MLAHRNSFSLIFGFLCLGVVYLHANWLGGFDIYSLGIENKTLTRLISLMLLSIVPSFFIMWGYLSSKYFYSDEDPVVFFRRKLVQFYPVYILSFFINFSYRWEHMISIPKWKMMLNFIGIYYETGMGGGGNIYLVVLFVLLTVTLFKVLKAGEHTLLIFTITCMVMTKILPHESQFCYIQYFGYYTAFFMGVSLKHFRVFEEEHCTDIYRRLLLYTLAVVGIATPFLNLLNIRFTEIQYDPNSYEQLLFCCLLIYGVNKMLVASMLPEKEWSIVKYFHIVGNNAYGHFIIHTHVIIFFVYVNSMVHFNKLLMQMIVIACTSYISVFWILRLYKVYEARVMMLLKKDVYPIEDITSGK